MRPSPQLLKTWYKKLKVEGFQDVEKNEDRLKEYHGSKFKREHTVASFKESERYWQLAGQLLHDYPFLDVVEKKTWKMYVEGEQLNKIARATRQSRRTVSRIIGRIAQVIKV